jgi:hypothetical protein
MRFGGLLVASILAIGLAGAVIALHDREGNSQFVSQQQSLTPVGGAQLERLILTTSDPRPGYGGLHARARNAHCVSAGRSALGNPWSCTVRYARAPDVRYRVTVYADRSIYGSGQPLGQPLRGVLIVRGCCVASAP